MADRKSHQLRGCEFGREDQVALVLSVLVVDHDNGVPSGDLGHRKFDGVEPGFGFHPVRPDGAGHSCSMLCGLSSGLCGLSPRLVRVSGRSDSSRSTYLAITSTSMFRLEPTTDVPIVVTALVSGMIPKVKTAPSGESFTSMTVSEMPSTAI